MMIDFIVMMAMRITAKIKMIIMMMEMVILNMVINFLNRTKIMTTKIILIMMIDIIVMMMIMIDSIVMTITMMMWRGW